MALEQEIQKLIIAVETLTKTIQGNYGKPADVVPVPKATKAKETPAPVAVPEVDLFEQNDAVESAVTFDSLTDLLKLHAKNLGTKVTVALIIKHGADRTTPKMNTIPEANFKACFDEATADLQKVKGRTK